MAKLRAAIRAGTRGASRTRRTTTSSRSTSSSSRVRTGSASTSNTFRGNVTSSVKQSGSSKSGDVVKGQKVSVSASGGEHVSIGGTPRTPRTPRTPSAPRAPGTSRSAAVPASAASPEASSARLKLYMKRIAAGEPLPPSASRNPELVAKARELLGFGQGTATVKVELPPYKPAAAKGEPLTDIQLASARKPSSNIKPPAVLAKIDAALKPSKPLASYGDRGPVVATLQHYLQNRGFDPGPIDGVWGPKTQAAFTAFQKAGNVVDWSTIAAKTPKGASRPEEGAYPVEGVKTGVTPVAGRPGKAPPLGNYPVKGTGTSHPYYDALKRAEADSPSFKGWADDPKLYELFMLESYGGNPGADNPTSTAYGMFQFLDATWATVGAKKTSDPYGQAVAGYRYIKKRYGTIANAVAFRRANGWY